MAIDQKILVVDENVPVGTEIRGTTINRIQSVLAETILTLNIDDGSWLVMPLVDNFDTSSTILSAIINKEDPEVRRLIGVAD